MPVNTNLAFREFGIALFFAAVGLSAGAKFFTTVFSATGLQWLLAGVCVTVLPLLLVGVFARVALKMNFMDLSGLLAGSMTDPPALAFASNVANSDAPTVGDAQTLSPYHALAHTLCAGPRNRPFPMNTPTLGEPRFASSYSHTISDELRIPERIEIGADPGLQFELAGPRAKLFFDPPKRRAGIGDVWWPLPRPQQRHPLALSRTALWLRRRRDPWLSRRLQRARPAKGAEPVKITPQFVDGIHQKGGTILSSSRGPVKYRRRGG